MHVPPGCGVPKADSLRIEYGPNGMYSKTFQIPSEGTVTDLFTEEYINSNFHALLFVTFNGFEVPGSEDTSVKVTYNCRDDEKGMYARFPREYQNSEEY
ncbi:hypothetical protein BGZ74_004268, partial [Mortierella antarctica]